MLLKYIGVLNVGNVGHLTVIRGTPVIWYAISTYLPADYRLWNGAVGIPSIHLLQAECAYGDGMYILMKRQSLTEIEKGIVLDLNEHASIVGYDTSYFYIATDLWKRKMIDVVCVGPKNINSVLNQDI